MLRLTSNRKTAELAMGYQAEEVDFEDAKSDRPQKRNHWLQAKLEYWTSVVSSVVLGLRESGRSNEDVKLVKEMVADELGMDKSRMQSVRKNLFIAHMLKIGKTKAKSTYESFVYTVATMRKFDSNADELTLEDIKYAWLADFEVFMKQKNLSQNTRKIHFGNIRIAMRDAYKRELTENDPFRRFAFRPAKTPKRSLQVEALRRLFDYPVEDYMVLYRDMFKLIFMLIGINTVDLFRLEALTDDGRVEYYRAKTGRYYSIKVEPEAMELIEKYKGEKKLLRLADRWADHRNFRHQCNAALKKIGHTARSGLGGKKTVEAEWPYLTTYWARHTWATIAADLEIPDATISLALGHAGENATTEIYIRRNQKKVDAANRKVLDYVLYGKS